MLLIKILQKQTIIQTINRKYVGKEYGFIVDYVDIRSNMMEAMQKYGGCDFGSSDDDVKQALDLLPDIGESKESFRKLGLTFEGKVCYDILIHLRDKYNFEYGEDKKEGNLLVNDKCKSLAKKIKELIDTQSSFADWLNNANVRADLNQKIFFCLAKNGYPPQYNDEVFEQVMAQVENFTKNH